MYLKRLEIYGFKSFHEKTALEFNGGITAVVGPNGSGKSNIADAIRWVLGEQSAKSLRGARMEDIIFSGTEFRRGLALAEVSLTLDNGTGSLSLGGERPEEIRVSRRLYRSGESQYLINGASVRLKDVHELFMDTGLGKEGYSIIGQGRIEDVLSVKSEDRRGFFEEAAGIVKYKAKRDEARAKLERERQAYDRVCDIITEIENNLEPMAEMAEKARRYLDLTERLKLVRINAFRRSQESWEHQEKQNTEIIKSLEEETRRSLIEREDKKNEAAEITARLEKLSGEARSDRAGIAALGLEAQKAENDIRLTEAHIGFLDDKKLRIQRDIEQRATAKAAGEAEKMACLDSLMELAQRMVEKTEEAQALRDDLDKRETAANEAERELELINAAHVEQLRGVADVKSKAEALAAAYSAQEARKEQIIEELEAALSGLDKLKGAVGITEEAGRANALALDRAEAEIARFFESKNRLDAEYGALKDAFKREAAALAEARSKHRLLTELEAGLEGYHHSVKNLLNAVKIGRTGLSGLHGAVGELIRVKENYEICVEVALGASITDIVAEDEEAAKAAIEYLKASKAGRATFLPLTALKPRKPDNPAVLIELGICGTAADFVSCEPVYRNVIENLLGRVIVAEDMDNAIAVARKYRHSYKIVTLAGEVLNPGGSITGGWLGKTAGILTRRRELTELSVRIAEGEAAAVKQNARLDALSAKLSGASVGLERAKVQRHETEIKQVSLAAELARDTRAVKEREERVAALEHSDRELTERLSAINAELRESKDRQKSVETGVSNLLADLAGMQDGLKSLKKARDEAAKRLSAAEAELSRLSADAASCESAVARAEESAAAALEQIKALQTELEDIDTEKSLKIDETEALARRVVELREQKEQAEARGGELEAQAAALEARLNALRDYELEAVKRESGIHLEMERVNNRREVMEADRRRVLDELWEEYGVTAQDALNGAQLDLSNTKLKQEEAALRGELREMGGSVNVGAAEEYRLIRERHAFMTKQRDDIALAEEQLNEVIAELNAMMEERFKEQFKLIAESFSAVFTEMFGGGSAGLKLTDERDALGSGIEIVAQPPGKQLQSMSLLSGGERALCAIALLFAILRLKPSPFCVLDEIETALDDANVKRFARFIKNYSGGTQFIVITHRKGTMETADALYGVTMQEAGVSKLISVKFEEDAAS
ncbi:MAG: chromosome segregation protein SMC [Clostridiales bacterium]|jgi:chromosome segregation protein|nr:chromosome segregation protein SMC [Clostridiales bacterium]